jgi:hypothetical protein
MKWNTGDVRGTLIKIIAEKILSEEFTDNSTARQALVDALQELKFDTDVSKFDTEDFSTLQIYYKSESSPGVFDRAIDVAAVPRSITQTPAQKALQKILSMDWTTMSCSILKTEIHQLTDADFQQLCSHLHFDRGIEVWKNDLDRVNGLQRDTVIIGNLIFKNGGPEGTERGCKFDMEITYKAKRKREHHTVVVDGIPYFRNEDFKFNFEKNTWMREKLVWSIGDEKGEGPYVEPKGDIDSLSKYTSQELEEMFNLLSLSSTRVSN